MRSPAPRRQAKASSRTQDVEAPLGLLTNLIGYRLRRANGAFMLDYARTLEPSGIRQVLFGILAVVSAKPGVKQIEVGRLLGIKRPNMVSLVNELTERGLIDRKVTSNDKRAFALGLTPAGKKTLDECYALILEHENRMLAGFSKGERLLLAELLQRIRAPKVQERA